MNIVDPIMILQQLKDFEIITILQISSIEIEQSEPLGYANAIISTITS
jgi:hypothetical protein